MRGLDHLPFTSLSDFARSNARFRANHAAAICGDERVSWRELDERVSRVANGLIASGLEPGDRVAIMTVNSVAMVEIILGINRAGCVSVPLSLLAPPDGLAAMIEDSGSRAVFVSQGFEAIVDGRPAVADLVPVERRFSVGFDPPGHTEFTRWRDRQGVGPLRFDRKLDDDCIIIYSSGTTGVPKGIAHSHYARQLFATGVAAEFRFTPTSVALVATPLYSNGTWLMFLPALATGAPQVIMPKFDPGAFLDLVSRERVTHLFMVPPQFNAILAHPKVATADFSSLETLVSAGSTMRADLKRQIVTRMSPGLFELYGLTEGVATILRPHDVIRKVDSVGTPGLGGDIRIIDSDGRELPRAEIGEIVGYTAGLMKGYHNRPEATAETVWLAEDGRTYLKTGDIGRLDDEGFLYILDRKKDMILSGAFNVYPRDIEEVLAKHPEVADVTVIGIPDPKWDEVPLALVIPAVGARPDPTALKEWINQRVGKHQRVAGVELREAFPRNALGKVLKKELRAQYAR